MKGSERGDERATVGELARRMQLAQSTVTELVNRVERAGLVHRTASTLDGRVAHIALTKEGEERFAIAFRALADERRALRRRGGRALALRAHLRLTIHFAPPSIVLHSIEPSSRRVNATPS